MKPKHKYNDRRIFSHLLQLGIYNVKKTWTHQAMLHFLNNTYNQKLFWRQYFIENRQYLIKSSSFYLQNITLSDKYSMYKDASVWLYNIKLKISEFRHCKSLTKFAWLSLLFQFFTTLLDATQRFENICKNVLEVF